jgi:hypothetical protein
MTYMWDQKSHIYVIYNLYDFSNLFIIKLNAFFYYILSPPSGPQEMSKTP